MSQQPQSPSLTDALLAEIADELGSLEGDALDAFLVEIGDDPARLLAHSAGARSAALAAQGKRRLEDARARVQARRAQNTATIVSFDIAKKRALLEAIRIRGEQTGDMTLAARNRTIESEEDLDSVLEAFLRLGIIDEQGEIKN